MNFADLKSEVARRGFDYLSDAALGRYVNDAYLVDICEYEDWLWLHSSVTGPAPLSIPDLRSVLYVIDQRAQLKLTPLRESTITDTMDVNLTSPGDPRHYYFTAPTVVSTYPTSTGDIAVTYTKTPPELTGSDDPLVPARFHTLISDAAVVRAYEDDDEWDAAGVAKERFDQRLQVMCQTNVVPQHDRPDDFILTSEGQ